MEGVDWLFDNSHGVKFQEEVCLCFGSAVHHSSSCKGFFYILTTFRRYTFWFMEDSVALALCACLGGSPASFHVRFLSQNHFWFLFLPKLWGFMFIS